MGHVNDQLRTLRQRAKLSVRAMADALGVPSSTYAAYEDPAKFKKDILPLDKAKAFAAVLEKRNVPRAEVLALAGVEPAPPTPPPPPRDLPLPNEEHIAAVLRTMMEELVPGVPVVEPVLRSAAGDLRAWLADFAAQPNRYERPDVSAHSVALLVERSASRREQERLQ